MTIPGTGRVGIKTKRIFLGLAILLMVISFPGPAMMASVSAADPGSRCNPVQPPESGTTKPTGAWAGTFTYNQCTGLWVSQYYTYNPATRQYSYNLPLTYTCDTSTWTWQTTQYEYIASHADYEPQIITTSNPPAGSYSGSCQAPAPQPSLAATPVSTNNSGDSTATVGSSNADNLDDSNSVELNNGLTSTATSGHVTVQQDTQAGDATSGDANASATIINSVNTTNGGQLVNFTKNINGNVTGDIIIDPNQLQPADTSLNNTNDVTINTKNSGTINNNLQLNAVSGDVNASQNTEVGNATSGNAAAMADVVNMLNTYVGAGQSFIGTINIYGNLHGNILMPPEFLTSLQNSGAPHTTVSIGTNNTADINNQEATNITNQIESQAKSGSVTMSANTESGNAASGSATTNVEVYNLTGDKIIGANSLLVFVNVMGRWVGLIVGAPAGASSANYGNYTATADNDFTLGNDTKNTINNNISVSATSGNVASTQNTKAGNATSGDATTAVSLANFSNDSINLTGWFGILFINVFGGWYGNFGAIPATTNTTSGTDSQPNTAQPPVFKFVPLASSNSSTNKTASFTGSAPFSGSNDPTGGNSGVMLTSANVSKTTAASNVDPAAKNLIKNDKFNHQSPADVKWIIIASALALAICLALASFKKPAGVR